MTDQPSRITPADLADLLDQLCPVPPDAPAADRVAFLQFKGRLLHNLAEDLGSPDGYLLSATAWQQATDLLCDNSQWEGAR